MHNGQKITPAPLSSKEAYLEQLKIQQSSNKDSSSEMKKKEKRKEAIREKK